jgi:protein-S-isoprenylcysteine O-methyltransferase Ste14
VPRIVPPVYFMAALVLIPILDRFAPIVELLRPPAPLVGLFPLALGLMLGFPSAARFRRAGTPLRPGSKPTVLVQDGPYRFTRNPMYLGMTLIVLGVALLPGSLSPLLVPPLFLALIQQLFVKREERWMEEAFGAAYLDYKRRVRRWL